MEIERSAFYYAGFRRDMLKFLPPGAQRVLSVGCGAGHTEKYLKQEMGLQEVVGIEVNAEVAEGLGVLDRLFIGDVENVDVPYPLGHFDCILYPDVLEHLVDPWSVLKRHRELLSDDGVIIISIPNVRYYYSLIWLLIGDWPYSHRGILDRSHLRFFTLRSLKRMLAETGFELCHVQRKYRLVDTLGDHHVCRVVKKAADRLNRVLSWLRAYDVMLGVRDFFAFQYIVVAAKPGHAQVKCR
jgi:SAM-dependent methyltransferase